MAGRCFHWHIPDTGNILEKYHFDFNHKWVANSSDTTRIAIRKIKAYPMNLTIKLDLHWTM
jgi:hypothetical protein